MNLEQKLELSDINSVISSTVENNVVKIKEELDSKLSEEQKKVVDKLYDQSKELATMILNHPTFNNSLKIMNLMGMVIKLVESISITGKKIEGVDKKQIALELGKKLISDIIQDNNVKETLLSVYNLCGESSLEIIIDVSRHVNVNVKEVASSCISELLKCLGRN
jgi:hypothetical protein